MGSLRWRLIGWNILFIVLLLSMVTSISVITLGFIMVPLLCIYVRSGAKQFAAHFVVSLIVVYALTGMIFPGWLSAFLIALALFFLPPVIQMGNLYKKKAPARSVITAGAVTLLGELLLSLIISYAFGFNLISKMKQFMRSSLDTLSPALKTMVPMDPDVVVQLAAQMLPLYMIGFSLVYVIVTHWVTRKALNRSGEQIPGFKPAREWMLPKPFVWYYMGALILEYFVRDSSSILFTLLINSVPLLSFAFAVQGIAFLFFIAHRNKWNNALPIAGIILFIVFLPSYFLLSLLGVFDVAFPIRDRLTKR
ncbi:DUF2232 domain-containing protein [Paenibacillus hamazuiensis]|uniref:DUF2232 domain-containing protein n=1 Tax=Paenibacillus hamazuiensis TaxID=2936508 RepID=UPI00200F2123|nr:DUF2232 domain-containing protein [Paenibacillus hamazuiensis]